MSGTTNRTVVSYKTTQSGATDPVSPTGDLARSRGRQQP